MEPTPSRAAFEATWRAGGAPVVWREILADCETAVSAFRKLHGSGDAFLLESVEGGEVWGRYSILGAGIRTRLVFAGGAAALVRGAKSKAVPGRDPLSALRAVLREISRGGTDAAPLPPPFPGGAVGWLSYDSVRHYAKVAQPFDEGRPDAVFLLPESWLVYDRLRSRIALVADTGVSRLGGDAPGAREAWNDAIERLDAMEARLSRALPAEGGKAPLAAEPFDVDDRAFMERVERAKEYVRAGDVIQVVLSRRRRGRFGGDPLDVYRALRLVNPSPYMFYLRTGDTVLAGSSPEALVRVGGGVVTTRPIAGTRPRGSDPAEDERRAKELVKDEKEKAEHLMLVDLGRNDLGRVAVTGSVKVGDFMRVERYSHVMHLVSDVRATLAPGKDAFDAVASVFPAGTLSGAPKVRAMQIVAELEKAPRGPYGGLVGWFGVDGRADTAIAIRMVRFEKDAGGKKPSSRFTVQAGAGIVFDSDPQSEAHETAAKAEGVMRSLALASQGLG